MEPKPIEIRRSPAKAEQNRARQHEKKKDAPKKELKKETRKWLLDASKELQKKDGRKALKKLATPPPQILETGEKKDIPTVAEKPVDEKPTAESKENSELSRRYKELKERTENNLKVLKLTISTELTGTNQESAGKNTSLEGLETQAKELVQNESLTPAKFVVESTQIIKQAELFISDYEQQIAAIEAKAEKAYTERNQISGRIRSIEQQSKGKQLLSSFESRKLGNRKSQLEKEIKEYETERPIIQAKKSNLEISTSPIKEKRQQHILEQIKETLTEIKNESSAFVKEALQNKQLLSELREDYIAQHIIPAIDEITRDESKPDRKITEAKKKDFLETLRATFDIDQLPEEQQKELRNKMNNFLNYEGGFSTLQYEVQQNVIEFGKNNLEQILTHVVVDDFVTATKGVDLEDVGKDLQLGFQNSVFEMTEKHRWYDKNQFTRVDFEENAKSDGFINWLQTAKNSKTLAESFGTQLEILDDTIYKICLDKSLTDSQGSYIDNLYHYPRPEVIRNLVLLATADRAEYRTVHANSGLTRFARRSDWNEILDESIKEYPSLKKARGLLQEFNYHEHWNHPDIREASRLFSLEVLSDKTLDSKLLSLAKQSLPNVQIIDLLVEKGSLSNIEAQTLISGQQTLLDIEINYKKENGEHYITDYYLNEKIRSNLFALDSSETSPDVANEALKRLKTLATICKEINTNKSNYEVVSYLSSSGVLSLAQENNSNEQKVSLILNSYQIAPSLLKDTNLVSFLVAHNEKYLNEKGLIFLNQASEAYGPEFKNEFHDLLTLVVADRLNPQALLDLPIKRKDILEGKYFRLAVQYPFFIQNENAVIYFRNFLNSYQLASDDTIGHISGLIHEGKLSFDRALELPKVLGESIRNSSFSLATENPDLYLKTDEDVNFYINLNIAYQGNIDVMKQISESLIKNDINRKTIIDFAEFAPGLMAENMKQTQIYIIKNSKTLLSNTSDMKFLNSLVGEFGANRASLLVKGYTECLDLGVITKAERDIVVDFTKEFKIISPVLIKEYKLARIGGYEKAYLAQLKSITERMTGAGVISEEERKSPYYKDLLSHVYTNNSGQWTTFESNESCLDRSGDLAEFKIKARYEIDLLTQSEIRVKAGEVLDLDVKEAVQKPILSVAEKMNSFGNDKEKIELNLAENIDKALQEIKQKGGLKDLDLELLSGKTDEKLFLVLTDSLYGTKAIDPQAIKDLVVTYEFARFEDISDYIAGTSDRVSRANNQDYALLCEVGSFYSDRIKEVNRRMVQNAWSNPVIASVMPEYFKKLAQDTTTAQQKDLINKMQVNSLANSDSFIKQLSKILKERNIDKSIKEYLDNKYQKSFQYDEIIKIKKGKMLEYKEEMKAIDAIEGKTYDDEEIKTIIQKYEGITNGLQENKSTSQNPQTRTFYGQLRSQREKTFEAIKVITGHEFDTKETHLGEIDIQQVLATEANIREGKYNEEQFASYTVQRMIDIFGDERTKINQELSKFESLSGKQRQVLNGYITKSKESAHARMVGGVCVCGDNPNKYQQQNIWDMPNYFQMVFQEPDSLQSQGLVLLHHFNENGKKVLTASYNPSSTYLYSVDEAALFNGISGSLEDFAAENGFDMITVSHNRTIRTNRTGGQFESAMDKKVAQVNKTFKFNETKQFSYHPDYKLQEMDVIWERKS